MKETDIQSLDIDFSHFTIDLLTRPPLITSQTAHLETSVSRTQHKGKFV